ncbi:septation protein SepH [Tessaracoccus flavus]|uniref:septation protein SepH n=1 Tax=Tessaracoccus flavus TaxID=1610493 RepID=UPI000895313B|nr:septation protein SepH [Tessaracoccus flavus]SDY66512.1 Protein of unknown function [Tessaracoccus flavus]
MVNALTPREIQARIRSGSSVDDVVAETGMSTERIEAFAGPVLAEREHIASAAQSATIRRRGEAGSHHRLREIIAERLSSRGIDSDAIEWDAWRQNDLKWRVVGRLGEGDDARTAEFIFDPKGRFSVAHNGDARWLIGEEPPGAAPEEENTVDFSDELALVRATHETQPDDQPGDDVPSSALMHDSNEDTSQLDRLYDMLSGISEDSVRIYTGIMSPAEPLPDDQTTPVEPPAEAAPEPPAAAPEPAPAEEPRSEDEPTQEPLVDTGPAVPKPRAKKRRAQVPSWDEIMFGGPNP